MGGDGNEETAEEKERDKEGKLRWSFIDSNVGRWGVGKLMVFTYIYISACMCKLIK